MFCKHFGFCAFPRDHRTFRYVNMELFSGFSYLFVTFTKFTGFSSYFSASPYSELFPGFPQSVDYFLNFTFRGFLQTFQNKKSSVLFSWGFFSISSEFNFPVLVEVASALAEPFPAAFSTLWSLNNVAVTPSECHPNSFQNEQSTLNHYAEYSLSSFLASLALV